MPVNGAFEVTVSSPACRISWASDANVPPLNSPRIRDRPAVKGIALCCVYQSKAVFTDTACAAASFKVSTCVAFLGNSILELPMRHKVNVFELFAMRLIIFETT